MFLTVRVLRRAGGVHWGAIYAVVIIERVIIIQHIIIEAIFCRPLFIVRSFLLYWWQVTLAVMVAGDLAAVMVTGDLSFLVVDCL